MLTLISTLVGCAPVPVDPTGKPFDVVENGDDLGSYAGAALGSVGEAPTTGPVGLTRLPPIPEPPTADELARANQDVPFEQAPRVGLPPRPAPEPAPVVISPSAIDLNWNPALPTRSEAFGVHLIGTMVDASPPNAVLRLPDGTKVLVEAGQMLDDAGLLVLAIGDKVIKLVSITKEGWYARVETAVLHSNPRGGERPAPHPVSAPVAVPVAPPAPVGP